MARPESELRAQAFNQDFSAKSLVNRTMLVLVGCGSAQPMSSTPEKWACDPSFFKKAVISPSLPDITDPSLSHVQ